MGMLSRWIARRQAAQGAMTPESEPALSRIADGALSPRLAQEQRIHRKAAAYRAQLQREAAARQAREAQAERARLQRAQAEFEDGCARSLAEGFSHFPHDRDGVPGPQIRPFEGTEGGPFYGIVRW
jgi:hypothetical protein